MNQKTEGRRLRNRIERKFDKIRSLRPRITDVGRIQDVEHRTSAIALEIGELLAAGEVSRKSREWQRWVRQFLPIRPETAGKYIRVWMIRERVRIELSYYTAPEEEYEPNITSLSALLSQSADLFSDIDGFYRGTLRYPMKRLTRNQMLDFTLQRLLDWDHLWHGGDKNESSNPSSPIVEDESVLPLARDDQALADKVIPLIKRHMLTATDLCRGVRRLCRYAERLWHLAEEALVDVGRLQEIRRAHEESRNVSRTTVDSRSGGT